MLANRSLKLQRQYENMDVHNIIIRLKELFDVISRLERYGTSRELFCYKMTEGSYMNTYVQFMIENYLSISHSQKA